MKTKEEILDSHIAAMISKYPDEYESLTKMKASPEYQTTLEAMEEHSAQFNKPPVYGQWIDVKSLEPESPDMVNIILEDGFRSVGRKYSNGWGVFFMDGEDLIKPDSGKRQVTHWMPLPPSPGSVDVEEKKECQHEALTDTGVGYHHCPTCNASFKVDGLGDSSGSEKEEEPVFDISGPDVAIFNFLFESYIEIGMDAQEAHDQSQYVIAHLQDKYTITRKP